ncbi:MAG TPA: hypothetical protein DDW95_00870 [Alphaproteobacteria bacterium]|jgi:predicted secreted protein|nr:hypothetical protein [Alphaproteobacteria bacterium]HBG51087.1 hypothetical protein [Gammaproteobacteria bacterium]HAM46234.1 hypothetical protein [Alphaproteobacteria bacterium]HBC53696.1 hypothetical protein [Alphaproteobacteria bacterium]HBF97076.1 hypothetical protein [Alphaproteobacteria bacterium]
MGLAGGLVSFAIIWMLCFFIVLPWGIQNHIEAGQEVVPGEDPAAPVRPRLRLKVWITTGVTALLWLALYYILENHLITLDDFPF